MTNTNINKTNAQATTLAEALALNATMYKNRRISDDTVSDAQVVKTWKESVEALRLSAYAVAKCRHNNIFAETKTDVSLDPVYDCIRPIIDLIGEVNGLKLSAEDCVEPIIGFSARYKSIDTTKEMAAARCKKESASRLLKQAVKDGADPDVISALEASFKAKAEIVSDMEKIAGNCRQEFTIATESAFMKSMEHLFGDAVAKQAAKSTEEIKAEIEAKKAERKARKAAKKAKAEAKSEEPTPEAESVNYIVSKPYKSEAKNEEVIAQLKAYYADPSSADEKFVKNVKINKIVNDGTTTIEVCYNRK